jgi:pSer/pThr/pTyr-binding forkhead associated (FHA) protein
MWKLTIEDDEGKQTSLPLAHDEYGLGRAEANAIRLTDRNISRKHAVLKKTGQGWSLRDLQSYNGTYINGTRVGNDSPVQSGDVVQLGDYRLELVDETQAAAVAAETGVPVAAPTLHPVHQRPNRLVVVVGPTPGAEFPLDTEHFTIGRSEEATISINHSSVSRVHAELFALGSGRFEIVDKGSANGIRINGVELKRGILEAGDALELGDVRLRFVGAGKIFRAGADQSQQLTAVGTFESVAPSVRAPAAPMPPPTGVGLGKLIGIGAGVGVLIVVAFLLVSKTGTPNTTDNSSHPVGVAPPSEQQRILKEATAKLAAKDVEGAHKMIVDLPEAAHDDPAFKAIEAEWAKQLFQQVDAAATTPDKRAILNRIATTPTVDEESRKKAASMIQQLDAVEPPVPQPQGTFVPRSTSASSGGPAPSVQKTADPAVTGQAPTGPPDEEAWVRDLLPKVASHRASLDEAMRLKAACRHLGNAACKAAAEAEIARIKAKQAP